jgi:hypothetical protein
MMHRNRRRLARVVNMRTLAGVLVVGVVALGGLTGFAFQRIGVAASGNCLRIHKLTHTLDRILSGSRRSLDAYERDGTITRAQRDRGLREIEKQRQELGGADCPPRAYDVHTGVADGP